jgi:tRNA(Ser,Leu) C12 N-acetylase TAN1
MTKDMYKLLRQIDEEVEPKVRASDDPKKIAKKLFIQLFNETAIAKHIPVTDELGVEDKTLQKQVEKIINGYQKQVATFIRGL